MVLTCIGNVVSIFAKKYVLSLYQLLKVSFFMMDISDGTKNANNIESINYKKTARATYISTHWALLKYTTNMQCQSVIVLCWPSISLH